jgi:hypothetical protein
MPILNLTNWRKWMNKIQQVSLFFRVVFQILFIVLPVLLIIGWMSASQSLVMLHGIIEMDFIPRAYTATIAHGSDILHVLTPEEKILGFCIAVIPLLIELYILYSLIKLFKLYEKNEIFSLKHVRYIKKIGYALLIGQIIHPFYEGLMGLVLTWHNPPGAHLIKVTLDQTNIGILFTALLVILISWIMAEGYKLREEQQLTI